MAKGPSDVSKSIALDYQSYFSAPSMFLAALRNRHWLVVCNTFTAMSLRLLVVLSMGLFFLQTIPFEQSVALEVSSAFARFNGNISDMPWIQFQSIFDAGGQPPFGFDGQTAFQEFADPKSNATLRVVVDGFWSETECVAASIEAINFRGPVTYGNVTKEYHFLNITSRSEFCPRGDVSTYIGGELSTIHYNPQVEAERFKYFGRKTSREWCGDEGDNLFALGYYGIKVNGFNNSAADRSMVEYSFTHGIAAHCRPRYYVGKVEVTLDGLKTTAKQLLSPEPTVVEWNVTEVIDAFWRKGISWEEGYSDEPERFGEDGYQRRGYMSEVGESPPVRMGLQLSGSEVVPKLIKDMDGEMLARGLGAFYRTFAALAVHGEYRIPEHSTVEGKLVSGEIRLVLQPILSHAMTGLLALLCFLSVVSASHLAPRSHPPANPDTILGMALLLRASSSLLCLLSGTGASTLAHVEKLASGTHWTTRQHRIDNMNRFVIADATSNVQEPPISDNKVDAVQQERVQNLHSSSVATWYRPFVLGVAARILMSVFLLTVIGALIALLRLSNRTPQGIANAPMDITYLHYLWTSLPSLIMVGIGLFFASVDTHTRSLSGFLFLDTDRATSQQLSTSFADRTAISALITSLRLRAWPIATSTTANILTAFLTISVSSLFVVQLVPIRHTVLLQREQRFAPEFVNLTETQVDYVWNIVSALPSSDFNYPDGIYENIIIPRHAVTLNDNLHPTPSNATTLHVRLPALRIGVECALCPSEKCPTLDYYVYRRGYPDQIATYLMFTLLLNDTTLPWDLLDCADYHQITYTIFYSGLRAWDAQGFFYEDIPLSDAMATPFDPDPLSPNRTSDSRCPTSQFLWGRMEPPYEEADDVHHAALLLCTDYADQVDVDVVLGWPGLHMESATRPPVVVPGSERRVEGFLPPVNPYRRYADITRKRYGMSVGDYGEEGRREEVKAAMEDFHRVGMAATIWSSGYLRGFGDEGGTLVAGDLAVDSELFRDVRPEPVEGVVLDEGTRRVVVNAVQVYILVGLMSVLVVLNSASVVVVRKRLVPKAPGSILGIGSLLADSNVFERLGVVEREGVGFGVDGEGVKRDTFSMGWFRKGDGDGMVFAIGVNSGGGGQVG